MLDTRIVPPPPAIVTRALSRLTRDQLAGCIAVRIDLLDLADGDAVLEPYGNEQDGHQRSQDGFMLHGKAGPGRPIAHPDFGGYERGEPDNGL